MKTSKALKSTSLACSFSSRASMKTCRNLKPTTWKRLSKSRKNKKRFGATTIGSNLNLDKSKKGLLVRFKRNTSPREAYTCWAYHQANPNLSEIPITQISDLMQTNAEKGRPMVYGCLKSDYWASTSSQADPQEPVPLRTAPPIPGFQPPHPPPN
ncbi:hypothetical protein PIB30_078154 [Stylosanthes scabra]|uniref:Uncharacterized protein n=1 Tax=Stylosanthes scabra TaxID=79078 RepID=A0ABU6XR00_9FABA|nr:hypothetical protein [Stylosanthes scabra]